MTTRNAKYVCAYCGQQIQYSSYYKAFAHIDGDTWCSNGRKFVKVKPLIQSSPYESHISLILLRDELEGE
jgi:hypothetical protein